jgi:hypothetical protein
MPRAPGTRLKHSADAQFLQALADVRQEPREESGAADAPLNPLAGAAFPVGEDRRRATGGASHWRAALDFLAELGEPAPKAEPPRPPAEPPRPPAESAEDILKELELTENLTEAELNRLRRLFMWRNHPDRRGESQRAGATRRVALANMLIDRAKRRLAARR